MSSRDLHGQKKSTSETLEAGPSNVLASSEGEVVPWYSLRALAYRRVTQGILCDIGLKLNHSSKLK